MHDRLSATTAFVALLGISGCHYQLPGPPMIIEMPEIGARVDVSGWLLEPPAPEDMYHVTLSPGSTRNARRFAGEAQPTGGFERIVLAADEAHSAEIEVVRLRASSIEDCLRPEERENVLAAPSVAANGFTEMDWMPAVNNGFEDFHWRTAARVKDGVCWKISASSRVSSWDEHRRYIDPVFASLAMQ